MRAIAGINPAIVMDIITVFTKVDDKPSSANNGLYIKSNIGSVIILTPATANKINAIFLFLITNYLSSIAILNNRYLICTYAFLVYINSIFS